MFPGGLVWRGALALAEFLGEQHELLANAQVAKGPEVLAF